jgi:hypothetical protein
MSTRIAAFHFFTSETATPKNSVSQKTEMGRPKTLGMFIKADWYTKYRREYFNIDAKEMTHMSFVSRVRYLV